MGSLKFCACTSEVTSAALREERGGGGQSCASVGSSQVGWREAPDLTEAH